MAGESRVPRGKDYEQPDQDPPIGYVTKGTPTGETLERVPTRGGPEREAQFPQRARVRGKGSEQPSQVLPICGVEGGDTDR